MSIAIDKYYAPFMSYVIEGYNPISVFHYFEDISRIPRSSSNEKEISNFLVEFAKQHNFEYYQDQIHNVIIKKAGSKLCPNVPVVVLQGHIDMVCEKNNDTLHDFDKDGLKLRVVDGKLMATGTTLGADNGAAVAIMLGLLDDDNIIHPPLECVFTVQEETGLCGAINIDASKISGRTMINLDSEEEGVATVSCAGGMRVRFYKDIVWGKGGEYGLKISVKGLNGGHSGMDIDKGNANANKLMGRVLYALYEQTEIRIASFNGGSKDNAIPREADAEVVFNNKEELDKAIEIINSEAVDTFAEFSSVEENLSISAQQVIVEKAMDKDTTEAIIKCIYLAPNGVKTRNVKAGGFTVCSINMGVVKTHEAKIAIKFAPRSSIASLQNQTKKELKLLSELFGFEFEVDSEYPGWSYAEKSPIRTVFKECYKGQYGKQLRVEAIHAGLECGLFCEKLDGLDAIAVGPTIVGCHTPQEYLDLASCERFYKLIVSVLERLSK
ncbi:MAG: aminoacyl-histidine dipeptidase [Oscillospiraceae bacterium]